MNPELSRIGSLVDDDGTTVLAAYTYLGVNRTAQVDFPEPGTRFTWLKQTGDTNPDPYNGWDRFGRAVDLRWMKGSTYVERIQHGYDRASNRLYRRNLVANESKRQDELYHYDGLSQLDDFQRGVLNSGNNGIESGTLTGQEQFNFDPTGNWNSYVVNAGTPQTRTHNQANELTQIDSSSALVAQDAAGNMAKVPKPDNWGAGYDLKYDAWNRLVEVKNSGGSTVATYGYDGLNRRITKTVGSDTRHYYYTDRWQIIEERLNASTSADRQFVWGLRYTDDLVLRDRGSERLYVIQDYFQPTAVTDEAGVVLERYGYEAFGTSRVMDDEFNTETSSSYEWETRFGAYRWDGETGLYQVRNRYLHPKLGRWVSRDPIEYEDGVNLYQYVNNTPGNGVDPSGLWIGRIADRIANRIIFAFIARLAAALISRWNSSRCACLGSDCAACCNATAAALAIAGGAVAVILYATCSAALTPIIGPFSIIACGAAPALFMAQLLQDLNMQRSACVAGCPP
jgi:RHS repeat-associated protein